MKIATGRTENTLFGVSKERSCQVLKEYYYNGEFWLTLKDMKTGEKFDSPEVLWEVVKTK